MAPQSPIQLQLQLGLHKDLWGEGKTPLRIYFTKNDFDLTWIRFFETRAPGLYRLLKLNNPINYVLADTRAESVRRVYTLECTVEEFMNGFKRSLQKYNANLLHPSPDMTVQPPKRFQQMSSPSTSTTCRVSNGHQPKSPVNNHGTYSRSHDNFSNQNKRPAGSAIHQQRVPATSTGNMGPSPNKRFKNNEIPPPVILESSMRPPAKTSGSLNHLHRQGKYAEDFFPYPADDDVASMANTVTSQDSVEDLREAGIQISKDVKGQLVQNIMQNVPNVHIHRMRKEMLDGEEKGNWVRFARHFPTITSTLRLVLDKGFPK